MTTNTEALAADTLDVWTINYSLNLDPHALHEFWSAGAPPACAMALKAAVAELRRLLAERDALVADAERYRWLRNDQPEQEQQSERQRFEAWFSRDDEFDLNPAWGNRTREGKYTFPDVQEAWEAWQAAHASILARLEAVPMKDLDLIWGEVGTANFVGWNACRAAMLAAAKGDTK